MRSPFLNYPPVLHNLSDAGVSFYAIHLKIPASANTNWLDENDRSLVDNALWVGVIPAVALYLSHSRVLNVENPHASVGQELPSTACHASIPYTFSRALKLTMNQLEKCRACAFIDLHYRRVHQPVGALIEDINAFVKEPFANLQGSEEEGEEFGFRRNEEGEDEEALIIGAMANPRSVSKPNHCYRHSFRITTKKRDVIIWCTKLMRSDADERVDVEVSVCEKDVGWGSSDEGSLIHHFQASSRFRASYILLRLVLLVWAKDLPASLRG
ncbi:hypothetical protein ARMGADRAFT_1077317 [Armillaria gallica]|uniref:Uncharacterized protein n=1 Tax=Armillaria gallica TaxID=47427 RepID=A0A2H3DPH4_ARMGA|nr:hypothetical protein ARMGADRAFT_1077317 [Armillaria gallica]